MNNNTIILQWLDSKTALVSINDQWCSWSFMDYTMGLEPPHYPVPATIPNAWCAQAFVFLAARLEDWCIAPLPAQMENLWLDLSGK